MAKIVCSVDTETKEMVVTLDGKEVADAAFFNAMKGMDYEGEEKCWFSVESRKESENKDYYTSTYIMSKSSKEGQEAIKAGIAVESKTYPDLILVKKDTNPNSNELFRNYASMINGH